MNQERYIKKLSEQFKVKEFKYKNPIEPRFYFNPFNLDLCIGFNELTDKIKLISSMVGGYKDLSKSPTPQPYSTNGNIFNINGYDNGNDNANNNNNNSRNNNNYYNYNNSKESGRKEEIPTSISVSSPYDNFDKHSKPVYSATAQGMAQLESQSEETVSIMKNKIGALRDLSIAMGTEINKSKKSLSELGEDMGMSNEKIKYNMNRMRRFVEKSGVGWKVWLGFTVVILWWFLWVWLF
ncbi:hypothetical protein C6P42_004224 [Pichia californica]|nr:hypothetical protein C6P42_004224 [[Candida] californica]